MEYWAVFNIAFFSSLSHCAGMCGGIVLGLNHKISLSKKSPFWANFLYHFGRISTYILIGALCGGLGIAFETSAKTKAISMIAVGILISLVSLLMFFCPKILSFLEPSVHKNRLFSKLFKTFYQDASYKSFALLGFLNGFLPCGIVYYFALIATASGGMIQGMGIMAIFGFCTLVPMVLVGLFSNVLLSQKWLHSFGLSLMFLFGLYTIYKGIKGL